MKTTLRTTFIVIITAISAYSSYKAYKNANYKEELFLTDIEALSNCESNDGYENNGRCVHDEQLYYFCKTPSFLKSKNCRMGYY